MVERRMRKEIKIIEEIKGGRERGQKVDKSMSCTCHDMSQALETSVEGQGKGLIYSFKLFTV